jgi:hypothetical protein
MHKSVKTKYTKKEGNNGHSEQAEEAKAMEST